MTATTHAPTRAAAPHRAARPSIARLTGIELRKMTDTRAGFWLLVVVALMAAGMVALLLFTAPNSQRAFAGFFEGTLMPVSLLLPVLGILSVTSEWSQRTAVTTFTLVPARWRTTVAKLLAGTVLAALAAGVCLAAGALGNLLVGPVVDGNGAWTIEASAIGYAFLYQLIGVIMGVAFGMLFMNTPVAIVLFFLLPSVWAILGQFVDALRTGREWLDQTVTLVPLTTAEMSEEAWAQVGATVGLWVILPLVVGLVRLQRREVS